MKKYNLIKFDDVPALRQKELFKYYSDFVSPGLAKFIHMLGFDKIKVSRAEGMYLFTDDKRKILDFSGGLGVLNHGHNHPRILEVRKKFNEEKRLEVCKALIPEYQAVLAKNLAELFPGDLKYSFFCNSGAEAVEGAMKISLLYQGLEKDKIIYTEPGYHGKTFGAMSVTGGGAYKELFKNLDGCLPVPYGDISAFEELVSSRTVKKGNDIAAVIVEAVHVFTALIPPKGYLKKLRDLCTKNNIILIADEVFTGFGRTGEMFAFEHEDIVPDIACFSKSLGGGKASVAGYIVKSKIFKSTYASMKNAAIHSTTFGGMAEECATAIEAINILDEEKLVENSKSQGVYLLSKLAGLKDKYPGIIKSARGIGLFSVLELFKSTELFNARLLKNIKNIDEYLVGLGPAVIISELLKEHDILLYPGGRNDFLYINPSLIVNQKEIDRFIDALDRVLGKGIYKLAVKFFGNII